MAKPMLVAVMIAGLAGCSGPPKPPQEAKSFLYEKDAEAYMEAHYPGAISGYKLLEYDRWKDVFVLALERLQFPDGRTLDCYGLFPRGYDQQGDIFVRLPTICCDGKVLKAFDANWRDLPPGGFGMFGRWFPEVLIKRRDGQPPQVLHIECAPLGEDPRTIATVFLPDPKPIAAVRAGKDDPLEKHWLCPDFIFAPADKVGIVAMLGGTGELILEFTVDKNNDIQVDSGIHNGFDGTKYVTTAPSK